MKNMWASLCAVCVLVITVYAYMAQSGVLELLSPDAAETYYNLLVRGFRAGHLSLDKEAPLGLTQLADPYDPTANEPYQASAYPILDMSYYKGRFYLYFGITPALILFWPFAALTGEYLFHRQAVTIFCAIGFLASVGVLRAVWQRYFPEVSVWVVAACALALGLATGVPVLLSQADVYEAAISCGYMLAMLALGAIWCALHEPERRCRWLATASTAYGLAVGARPTLLFGGIILLVPVIQARRERRPIGATLMAATIPITLIGLGLMLYNELRFDDPLEFGVRYQLAGQRQVAQQFFNLHYLWVNLRAYSLASVRWSARFPFVHGIVKQPLGILINVPVVWLALAAPLARGGRLAEKRSILFWFLMAVALQFGVCALTLGCFSSASFRYEVDFLPALLLLAVVGILALECALADQPVRRRAVRCGWGVLLGFSVAFNLLASVQHYAEAHTYLGKALGEMGQMQEAIGHFEHAVRLEPDFAVGQNNLGAALLWVDRPREAIGHFEQAVRLKPDFADAHYNLAVALSKVGRLREAIEENEQAVRLKPDFARGHNDLGTILWQAGKVQEAIGEYERALQINPDLAETHYNLAVALEKMGRAPEAIEHYKRALKIRPDFAAAKNALIQLRAGQ